MTIFFEKADWSQTFDGYEIVDCAVRDKNILYFCARKTTSNDDASMMFDSQIPTRLIALYLDADAGSNWSMQDFDGMHMPNVGVAREPFNQPGALLVSKNKQGQYWSRNRPKR